MLLVTGSTGFIGQNLLPVLKEKDYSSRCLIRANSSTESLQDFCCEKVIGDILDESSLKYAMKGVERVIHLAGVRMELGSATFEGIFYLGTRHVVDVAKASGVKHMILISAYGARPRTDSKFLHYKWMAEEYLRNSGLDYTILRPTIVYGPHDHFITRWINKIKRFPVVPVLGRGDYLLQPVSVGDVIQCVVRALEDASKNRKVYDLGGPDCLKFNEILKILAGILNRPIQLLHLPWGLVKPFARFCDLTLVRPPFTPDEVSRWKEDRVCDYRILEKEFDFHSTRFEEGLKQYFSDE